jgi:hypothetical protein
MRLTASHVAVAQHQRLPHCYPPFVLSEPADVSLDAALLIRRTEENSPMPTFTVSRGNISAEEVGAVLRSKLAAHYELVPSAMSTGVKGRWFERANIRIIPSSETTEIEVNPGASYFGLVRLVDRLGISHKVRRILESSPELSS